MGDAVKEDVIATGIPPATSTGTFFFHSPFISSHKKNSNYFPYVVEAQSSLDVDALVAAGWISIKIFLEQEEHLPKYNGNPPLFEGGMSVYGSGACIIICGGRLWAESSTYPLAEQSLGGERYYIPNIRDMVRGSCEARFLRSPQLLISSNGTLFADQPAIVKVTTVENRAHLLRHSWTDINVITTDILSILHQKEEEEENAYDDDDEEEEDDENDDDDNVEGIGARHFEGMDKEMIIEMGNGLGGGSFVRQGLPLLRAYAKAYKTPYRVFLAALRAAPGELSSYWLEVMTEEEIEALKLDNDADDDVDDDDADDAI